MARIRLWVDDQRLPPPDFNAHAKTYVEAIDWLKTGKVVAISLDHDLGEDRTGHDVATWIEEMAMYGAIGRIRWTVHTENPVGRARILQALNNAETHWRQNSRC
jgi:hypothetical protein